MSGSPKCAQARLRAEQERRLREERERRAAQERARRAAEEERRRRERLARVQRAARTEMEELEGEIVALAGSEAGRFVQADLQALRDRLRQAAGAIERAEREEQVRPVNAELRQVRDALFEVVARGEAARQAAHLAREEAAIAALRGRFQALDRARGEQFDAAGRREVEALLKKAEEALRRKALPEANRAAAEADARLQRHQAEVEERFAHWMREKEEVEAALAGAEDRLSGLQADEIVRCWAGKQVGELQEHLRQATSLIEAGQFDAARRQVDGILRAADEVVARAQAEQLKEERRQYIVQGIVQVMGDLGFVVQAGSPALEDAANPASPVYVQAQRLGGGSVEVWIPQEGEVEYYVDGFPMRVETGSDGQPCATCDEAEGQILALHDALADAFGIEMGELTWEGKDPDRIARQADQLPGQVETPREYGREG